MSGFGQAEEPVGYMLGERPTTMSNYVGRDGSAGHQNNRERERERERKISTLTSAHARCDVHQKRRAAHCKRREAHGARGAQHAVPVLNSNEREHQATRLHGRRKHAVQDSAAREWSSPEVVAAPMEKEDEDGGREEGSAEEEEEVERPPAGLLSSGFS